MEEAAPAVRALPDEQDEALAARWLDVECRPPPDEADPTDPPLEPA